ncbi:MAG: hypothetical protein ABWX94_02700 [Candidatus Saccharimonadales bacterium]
MLKQKSKILASITRVSLIAMLVIGVAASFVVSFGSRQHVSAATNSTLNFQARLLTISGNLVADGNYNVEFKLYNASSSSGSSQGSCSGDANCLWTETRTTSNKVRVVNGYMTVNLGSVNAFSALNWDQEMWLTMNIGGTATPGWDGEMNPRLKLTAVPYAFRAGQLVSQNGANINTVSFAAPTGTRSITIPDESGTICLQSSSACGFLTAAAANLGYIQNQTSLSQVANFRINGTGRADVALQAPLFDTASAGALAIGTTNATSISLQQNVTVASGKTVTIQGNTLIQPASDGIAFNVKTSLANNVFTVDTANARVGIALGGSVSPTLQSTGLEIKGGLRFSGASNTFADAYDTPKVGTSTVNSLINVVNYDPGTNGQIIAVGIPIGADITSRALSLFDGRAVTHQPTLAVLSPDETQLGGFSWDGSNSTFFTKTSTNTMALQANGLNVATFQNVSSVARVGIGNGSPSYPLDVTGDINSTTALRVGGNIVCTSTGCTSASGSGSYIQNQTAAPQTANFVIQGVNTTTNTATIKGVLNQDNDLLQFQASTGTPVAGIRPSGAIYSAAINDPITDIPANARLFIQPVANASTAIIARASSGGAPTGDIIKLQNAGGTTDLFTVGAAGATTITNATSGAFRIQDGSSNPIFTVNGSNSRVGIGNVTPSYSLDVVGDINSSTAIRVAGTVVCDTTGSTGCTAKSGSGFYIHNQTTVQSSNMYVQAATSGSVAAKFQAFNGGAGNIAEFLNGTGTTVGSISSVGAVLFKPSTNSTSGFQVQPSGSTTPVLNVDTQNSRVGIGTATPTRSLDILTNDSSNSAMPLIVQQLGVGDVGIELKNTNQSYYVGVDTGDSNKFKITSSSASGTATAGVDTVGSLTDAGDSNFMNSAQFTAGATGVISTLFANVGTTIGTAPNNVAQMALYTNSGGNPGTLLASTSATTIVSGWNSFTLSAPVSITNGTVYWIAYNTNGTTGAQNNLKYEATGGTSKYAAQTYGTWPSSFGPNSGSAFKFSMYGIIQASAGSDSFANNLFQLTTNGQATFKNNSNSTTAFQVQNASSTSLFTVDTTAGNIQIGSAVTDATATELILDSYNSGTDPTGVVGAMYYNTSTGNFRCFTATKWNNCGGLMLSTTNSATINSCTAACGPVATAPNVWVPGFCTVGRVIHMYASGVFGSTGTPTLSMGLYIGTTGVKATTTPLGVGNVITPGATTAYGWEFDGYIICNSTTSVIVHGATSFLTNNATGANADSKIYSASAVTITDTAQSLYLFPTWSANVAANTITANQFIIETM